MSLVSLCGHLLRTALGTYGSIFLHKIIDYEALFFNSEGFCFCNVGENESEPGG